MILPFKYLFSTNISFFRLYDTWYIKFQNVTAFCIFRIFRVDFGIPFRSRNNTFFASLLPFKKPDPPVFFRFGVFLSPAAYIISVSQRKRRDVFVVKKISTTAP